MKFSDIVGNGEVVNALVRMVDANRLSHAILLCEEDGGGGLAIAVALAQYVNCASRSGGDSCGACPSCHKFGKLIHPDLHFVFPVNTSKDLSDAENKKPISDLFASSFRKLAGENPYFTEAELYDALNIDSKNSVITVNEARSITEKLSLHSNEALYRAIIIYLPEKMNAEAANKLLKLLEEPPAGTLFVMISHKPERLLQTIRSRCQIIQLRPLSKEERSRVSRAESDNEEFFALMSSLMEAGLAKRVSDTFDIWEAVAAKPREQQREFCVYAENYIRKMFLTSQGMESISDIQESKEDHFRTVSKRIRGDFYERAFAALEKTLAAIESNGNPKLIFCDLCNRILLSL